MPESSESRLTFVVGSPVSNEGSPKKRAWQPDPMFEIRLSNGLRSAELAVGYRSLLYSLSKPLRGVMLCVVCVDGVSGGNPRRLSSSAR